MGINRRENRVSPSLLPLKITTNYVLVVLGILSLTIYVAIYSLSKGFIYGQGHEERPIITFLILYGISFLVYGVGIYMVISHRLRRSDLILIFVFSLLFRIVLIPSNLIQEDDIYRYLWDGKVLAHGVNPFAYSPGEVLDFASDKMSGEENMSKYSQANLEDLERLDRLRLNNAKSQEYFDRINYKEVRSAYPPLSQVVFAASYYLKADSIPVMKGVFLLFDLLTIFLLIKILALLGKKPTMFLVYAWSPLIIKEFANSGHNDAIAISMLTLAIYLFIRSKRIAAMGSLALATLAKIYPVAILPLIIKRFRHKGGGTIIKGLLVFVLLISLFCLPFLKVDSKIFSGFSTYARQWEVNDSLFAVVSYLTSKAVGESADLYSSIRSRTIQREGTLYPLLTRIIIGMIFLCFVVYPLVRGKYVKEGNNYLHYVFVILGAEFILSPVQYPWHLCWIVPLLCIYPYRSWMLLTGLSALYYLRFYFHYQHSYQYFLIAVLFEYLPFYLLLGWEIFTYFRKGKYPTIQMSLDR